MGADGVDTQRDRRGRAGGPACGTLEQDASADPSRAAGAARKTGRLRGVILGATVLVNAQPPMGDHVAPEVAFAPGARSSAQESP